MTSPLNPHTTPARRWIFFGVISLGLLMIGLDNSILYTALPSLSEQLHASESEQLWIINAYPLILAGLLLGTGTLGDRIGHRRMFLTGLTIFGAASLLAAFAPSATLLIAARALLGFGAATMMPATLALIRLTFAIEQERNIAIGIWGAVATVGAAAGPVVGGVLLEHFWWGSVFLINVPIVLLALALTGLLAPPNITNPHKHWDFISSFLALIALGGLTLAIKGIANPHGLTTPLLGALGFVLGGAIFVHRQLHLSDPLLTFDIFRSRIFAGGVIAASGAMFVLSGTELMTTQKLQLADGFTALEAGLAVVAAPVAAIPTSVLGGALLSRIGFLPIISGGFAAIAAGIGTAAGATWADNFALFVFAMALVGLGAGSAMSVSSTAIIGAAPAHRSGMAAGVEEVAYEFGTLISVAAVGSLMPMLYHRALPPGLSTRGLEALQNAATQEIAAPAYTQAYILTGSALAACAAIIAIVTARCFKNNPKSGGNGGH